MGWLPSFRLAPILSSSSSSPSSSSPSSAPWTSPLAAAGLGGLTAAIAAHADDSARGVRIAYNAKQSKHVFLHTIWTSTMLIWCLGSHDRPRLVVINFLRSLLKPLKVSFWRNRKEATSPGMSWHTLYPFRRVVVNQTSTFYVVRDWFLNYKPKSPLTVLHPNNQYGQ